MNKIMSYPENEISLSQLDYPPTTSTTIMSDEQARRGVRKRAAAATKVIAIPKRRRVRANHKHIAGIDIEGGPARPSAAKIEQAALLEAAAIVAAEDKICTLCLNSSNPGVQCC